MIKIFPEKNDSMLLLIDFQTGFLKPFDKSIERSIEDKIILMIELAKYYELPIVVMEQNNEKLGKTTEKVQQALGKYYNPFNKFVFSAYKDDNIRKAIEETGKKNIIICGIETHICILQTTIDLLNAGYKVHVVSDAVGSRKKFDWEYGLLKLMQIQTSLFTAEMILFDYLERSDTNDFKYFLKFLK